MLSEWLRRRRVDREIAALCRPRVPLKWGDDAADATRMSTPPPAPDDGPLNFRDVMATGRGENRTERDELRSLRRTVQGALVAVVAIIVIAGLIALAHSLNGESARTDCVASGAVNCE
jgi:hypothetical protein